MTQTTRTETTERDLTDHGQCPECKGRQMVTCPDCAGTAHLCPGCPDPTSCPACTTCDPCEDTGVQSCQTCEREGRY